MNVNSSSNRINFTSVLPTRVMHNGKLCENPEITEKVMSYVQTALLKKPWQLSRQEKMIKDIFTKFIPEFNFTPKISTVKDFPQKEKQPSLGYFLTDKTAVLIEKLSDRDDLPLSILKNYTYRAKLPQNLYPEKDLNIGLCIDIKDNDKLILNNFSFRPIEETSFIPKTCLIA